MGLASAPGAFQNMMEMILNGLLYKIAWVHVEDFNPFGRKFEENLERLEHKNIKIETRKQSKENSFSCAYFAD